MNSFHNLDPSLFRHDAPNTPQSNVLQEYHRQAPQTQNYNELHSPPGAESMGPLPPSTQPCPARLSLQDSLSSGHTEIGGEHASSRMLSPFSANVQTDEHNNVMYSSSPSRSVSVSPSSYPSRAPVHGESQLLTCVTATETEPKDSGIHLYPSCRLILQVDHLGVTRTLTSEPCPNHRTLRQSQRMEVGLPTTPEHFKWPLRLRSCRQPCNQYRCPPQ